ncbi:MAG: IS5 family transposase [Burkholderiaceae bacterium]
MSSFFLSGALEQVRSSPTMKLHALIDWAAIDSKLVGLYKRESTHGGGPIPYAPLSMFKLMLLGQWHHLSDAALEQALKVRLDFLVFCGFDLGAALPDHSTICRFRNRLIKAKLDEPLLAEINTQLGRRGLKVNKARGAIIDASIIEAASRPNRTIEVEDDGQVEVKDSADPEAKWVKKGNKAFFGYRAYVAVDTEDGFVDTAMAKPANESETKQFKRVVRKLPEGVDGVLADKGFASEENRKYLGRKKLTDLIQYRGHPMKPLLRWQIDVNKLISKMRYKVEQCFGTLKRRFHLDRARYFGRRKLEAQVRWAAIGYNLLKAHRKLERLQAVAV